MTSTEGQGHLGGVRSPALASDVGSCLPEPEVGFGRRRLQEGPRVPDGGRGAWHRGLGCHEEGAKM